MLLGRQALALGLERPQRAGDVHPRVARADDRVDVSALGRDVWVGEGLLVELDELSAGHFDVAALIELDAEIRSVVAANASAVDRAELPASWLLPELAQRGLLDSGAEDVANLAHLIDTIAQEDLATAFSVWAHRMVLEYLTRAERSPFIDEELAELRTGARVGSTAMASGVKALAGIEALPVTATRDGDGLRLDGVIPWASNLTANGTVVLPAGQVGAPPIAVALRLDTPGITRRDVPGLLALEATASGSLQLSGVRVDPAAVLSGDLGTLVRGFRPAFLILQSSFALGLARRAVAEAQTLDHRPDQLALRPQVQAITAALARHTATRTDSPRRPPRPPTVSC